MKKYTFNHNYGFTLIELLIVIAIIGILAAVLIPNLLTARAKSTDAAIIQTVKGIQPQALLYHSDNDTYTGICSDPKILTLFESAVKLRFGNNNFLNGDDQYLDPPANTIPNPDYLHAYHSLLLISNANGIYDASPIGAICHEETDGSAWAISVPLKLDPTISICIDSVGNTKSTYLDTNQVVCPDTN